MRTHQDSWVVLALCLCAGPAEAASVSYLQSPLAGALGFPSSTTGFQTADNFSFARMTKVTTVRWWGTYQNNPPSGADPFTVRFFAPDPLFGGAPQVDPSNQFTNLPITRTNSGLIDAVGDPIYRYDSTLTSPVIFSAGATAYFSVLSGASNPWYWQKSTNVGSNWYRDADGPDSTWFSANNGNVAFQLLGNSSSPGDYNVDFIVDQADYVLWRQNIGSTTQLAADGNGNGKVDAADYVVWRRNLEVPAATSSSMAAVPEPSSLQFVVLGLFVWSLIRGLFSRTAFYAATAPR
jgi:hypothetical protein